MSFLYPIFLWGLTALSIPILVHLFSFRRAQKVTFSQTAFLKEVRRETKSRSLLRHLLVLLMRMLAITAVVLAFAEPVLEAGDGTSSARKLVSIYIDNSPSMSAEGADGLLLETAKSGAISTVDGYDITDQFHVFTTDFLTEDQRFLSKKEALDRIAGVAPSDAVQPLEEVMMRQLDRLEQADKSSPKSYVFSDLQISSHAQLPQAGSDSSLALRFIALEPVAKPNVRIDSAWFEAPMRLAGRSEQLHVRIKHDASRAIKGLPLSFHIDGNRIAIGGYDLEPGRATDTVLKYTHPGIGLQHGAVRLDDAPITFDDTYHIGYQVVEQIPTALVIGSAATVAEEVALARIFSDQSQFALNIQAADAARFAEIEQSDLVVVAGIRNLSSGWVEVLARLVEDGGSVLLIPPPEALGAGWADLTSRIGAASMGLWTVTDEPVRIGALHAGHPHFEGVFTNLPERLDLPKVRGWHNRPEKEMQSERALFSMAGGAPFVTAGALGRGSYYVLSSPLQSEWNNFSHHALWVPTLLRMAETARRAPLLRATAGRASRILIGGAEARTDAQWTIERASDFGSTGTSQYGGTSGALRPAVENLPGGVAIELPTGKLTPGNYTIIQRSTSGLDSSQYALAVNPDSRESQLDCWSHGDFSQALEVANWQNAEVIHGEVDGLSNTVQQLEGGLPLWLKLIAAALGFLLLEMLLLKLGRPIASPTLQHQP